MHDSAESATLLGAVAEFLMNDVRPKLDARLSFRALIAANLLQQVIAELKDGAAVDKAATERLRALLPDANGDLSALGRELATRLRARDPRLDAGAARRALMAELADGLRISNPMFDLATDAGEKP